MKKTIVTSALVAAALPVLGLLAPLTSADAATAAAPTITAHPSDETPASGQQFVVRGLFTDRGAPAVGETVRIQSLDGDTWTNIPGARVTANEAGRYRVRLILQRSVQRDLRAVGVTPGPRRNAFDRFTVTVG